MNLLALERLVRNRRDRCYGLEWFVLTGQKKHSIVHMLHVENKWTNVTEWNLHSETLNEFIPRKQLKRTRKTSIIIMSHCENWRHQEDRVIKHAVKLLRYGWSFCTFSFLPIGQFWRYDQFSLLSWAHVLQAFIPAFDCFSDAQSEPDWLLVTADSTGQQTQV